MDIVHRSRAAGERMDRVSLGMRSERSLGMDVSEYEELLALAREGLKVVADAPPERQAVLLEMEAFSEFLLEEVPRMRKGWEKRRAELVAAGRLPAGGGGA
jgi:hypothetical protein